MKKEAYMYIKSLRIRNNATDVIMREVPFHKGANFIVDTENSGRHNKVGKTTFLKLIDILMGAKDRKLVYTDQETNNEVTELRNIIVEKQVSVEMTLSQNLETPYGNVLELQVELFPRGHYFINGERLSLSDYRLTLNKLLFNVNNNIPSFRELINSFVRVSVGGNDSSFLRTLPRASNAKYRSVYNYLFGISDPALDSKLSQLNADLKHAEESLRQYKRVNGVDNLEQQKQVLIALENEYAKAKILVDDIFNADKYKSNRNIIAAVRSKYLKLADQISEVNYRIDLNKKALKSAKAERDRQADPVLVKNFFDEVCSMLPNINKTFEEMVSFNRKLCDNKIDYFEEIESALLTRRMELQNEQEKLLLDNSQYLSLIAEDKINEYEQLSNNLMQIKQDIGKKQEIIDTLNRYESELSKIKDEIDNYSTGGSAREGKTGDYQAMMSSFNSFFTSFAQRINNETPILVYEPDTSKFPVSIAEISGSSTGTRKSLMAAFDLAYQQFAKANNICVPHFIVHDVVENVEGEDLRTIVAVSNEIDAQYIVAVLKEKLDSSKVSDKEQEKLQILQLAEDDRLFEGRTVCLNEYENTEELLSI